MGTIPIGADFRQVLTDEVAKCDVMLVVIGRQWITIMDQHGKHRLENPSDFVRIEVEAALARNIPVIPIIVQSAVMPHERELPASLAKLAYSNGIAVRSSDPFFTVIWMCSSTSWTYSSLPFTPRNSSAREATHWPAAHCCPPKSCHSLNQLDFSAYRALHGAEYISPPLCNVPAGPFLMGSDKRTDPQAFDDELPQHSVTLAAFQIGKYPVTVAEYACFVRAGQQEPRNWQQQLGKLDHPVVYVSWQDAAAYAQWLASAHGSPGDCRARRSGRRRRGDRWAHLSLGRYVRRQPRQHHDGGKEAQRR